MRAKQSFKSKLHLASIMGSICLVFAALILCVAPSSSADSIGTLVHVNASGEDEEGHPFSVWVTCILYPDNFSYGNFTIGTSHVRWDNRGWGQTIMYPYASGVINEGVINEDGTLTVSGEAFSFSGRKPGRQPFTLTINRRVVDNVGAVSYQEPDSGVPALDITLFRGQILQSGCGQRF